MEPYAFFFVSILVSSRPQAAQETWIPEGGRTVVCLDQCERDWLDGQFYFEPCQSADAMIPKVRAVMVSDRVCACLCVCGV